MGLSNTDFSPNVSGAGAGNNKFSVGNHPGLFSGGTPDIGSMSQQVAPSSGDGSENAQSVAPRQSGAGEEPYEFEEQAASTGSSMGNQIGENDGDDNHDTLTKTVYPATPAGKAAFAASGAAATLPKGDNNWVAAALPPPPLSKSDVVSFSQGISNIGSHDGTGALIQRIRGQAVADSTTMAAHAAEDRANPIDRDQMKRYSDNSIRTPAIVQAGQRFAGRTE